jgi:ATP-dependent Clp protease ATP-binding subunit ClpB
LDEIEKAHPDVFNILLQVLEDGRLTDNKGRIANFKNTIIIMTSNIGSNVIRDNFEKMTEENKEETIERTQNMVFEILKQSVRPEFLNRIDEVVMFRPLSRKDIRHITELQLNGIRELMQKQGIELEFTEQAMDWLAEEGFHPEFGARPLKRVIQKRVLNKLSDEILLGKIHQNSKMVLDVFDGTVVFRQPTKAESNGIKETV